MKISSSLLLLLFICSCVFGKGRSYVGSTPAHHAVRNFLGISLTDSIDFIRWKLVIDANHYELQCQYGIGKPGTPGFIDEKKAGFSGSLKKEKEHYYLEHAGKTFLLLEINSNLLYLLDENKNMLVGNGGYSYALNSDRPVPTDQFNISPTQSIIKNSMVFEGRTPCQELSNLLDLNKGPACDKMKWYFVFYTDSVSGRPSHYLMAGIDYRKEAMARGKWQIIHGKDGRIIYKLDQEKQTHSLYLLQADQNVLFFTDAEGHLLVGNENFSYTLNRRKEYPAVSR